MMPPPDQAPGANPMQGGAGGSPAAGGPPAPMGQPSDQAPAPPGAAQPGPGGGINAQQLIAKAGDALKSGAISPQQFKEMLTKLGLPPEQIAQVLAQFGIKDAPGAGQPPPGGPPGGSPAGPAQAAPNSPAWGA